MALLSFVFPSPLGHLRACLEDDILVGLSYTRKPLTRVPRHKAAQDLIRQFKSYFAKDPKHRFRVKITLRGTVFQTQVWQTLQTIPVGTVVSYGDIAKHLRSGPRAVGHACGCNPVAIIVPCHRVLAAGGGLGGYTGGAAALDPLHTKAWLLGHEGAPLCAKKL